MRGIRAMCNTIVCDPFSRAPHRRIGGDGMQKKDTEIHPERAFLC
jgi:hypothetical protein